MEENTTSQSAYSWASYRAHGNALGASAGTVVRADQHIRRPSRRDFNQGPANKRVTDDSESTHSEDSTGP